MQNFIVRSAVKKDAICIAKVHVNSWKTTYKGFLPDSYLDSLTYEKRVPLWEGAIPLGGIYVVEDPNGKIVGFASGGKERSGNYKEHDAELYAIYLLEEVQGLGLGKLLVQNLVNGFKDNGYSAVLVMVLEGNTACKFYEALGGKVIDSLEDEIAGVKVTELVYGWSL
ncbi:GNAT family N-acetyltransferase [Mangrovibacillus cuniculi]|uniref:GNAT family N-acetyltransferase n=1 Tax=Mangrovibacillus cuniculi TaxID=2593652 RepID=A0A7S8HFM0_9BACI|nr:GNAT family N-acetyltransferase [Mangrovibacillus cuniculi]QPC46973.1 GNAT family N-acetyltransferase [Mangrovibacillus cuniculi]